MDRVPAQQGGMNFYMHDHAVPFSLVFTKIPNIFLLEKSSDLETDLIRKSD